MQKMYLRRTVFLKEALIFARHKRFFSKDLSSRLVSSSDGICHRIAHHRFYSEMIRGTLCKKRYKEFIDQDIIYLRSAIGVLKIAKNQFCTHENLFSNLIGGYQREIEKFSRLQSSLESSDDTENISSACSEYVSILSDAIQKNNLIEFIALILACYLIFQRIAVENFISIYSINSFHPYFDFLKDLNNYKIINSENMLLNVLDAEINSRAEHEKEFLTKKVIDFFILGLECEIKLLDSLYE